MTTKHARGENARKQERLARLPASVQAILADRQMMRSFLAIAHFTRKMLQAGFEPTPGYGVAQHDAAVAVYRDLLGEASLSDGEFEYCLRVMTPPECRECEQ